MLAPDPSLRSTATQVMYGLRLVSLVAAVLAMGAWWIATDMAVTPSTTLVFLFATVGLWVTILQVLIFGIKQMVRGRIAQRNVDGA